MGILRGYGGALLTVLTMTYMATRLATAMATWLTLMLSVLTTTNHHTTYGEPQNQRFESTNIESGSSATGGGLSGGVYDPFPATLAGGGGGFPPTPSAPSSRCPPRCACFGDTVDCARRGLTRMPSGVPPETQRL